MSNTSTERRGRFRIERVCDEARAAGYGHAWHVFDENGQDPYVGTFPTREEARAHVRQALSIKDARAGRRPERWFGSPLLFTCESAGRWVHDDVQRGRWEIERRRAEPGHPAGWYVFGPNVNGERAGEHPEDAAEMVFQVAHQRGDR